MKDYLFSHGFDSEIQRIISTIEKGGYSGEIVKFHEKVEVHEIYRSYKLYCTLKGLSCVSIEDLFNSDGDSVKVFYSSGEYTKAKEEAHKKALVAEHSFIYHTAKKMGYHLNFSALAHAHPLRKRAPKDTEFVLDFFHGYKKEYTDTELADAKRFYEDMGVTGWPSDGKEVKPDFGSDNDTSSSGGSSGLKLSLSYGSSADQRLKSKVKV
jgi:hypothetical protein